MQGTITNNYGERSIVIIVFLFKRQISISELFLGNSKLSYTSELVSQYRASYSFTALACLDVPNHDKYDFAKSFTVIYLFRYLGDDKYIRSASQPACLERPRGWSLYFISFVLAF